MSVSVVFSHRPTENHPLQIVDEISQGKFTVYHTYSPSHKAQYALKVFPKTAFGEAQYQKETVMFNLSHKNIIQAFPINDISTEEDTSSASFNAIVTEFAQYGDVFDLVVAGVFDSETIIRTYFHQLIQGLEYLHSERVAHLDLKLENLMIGEDFTLKIIDFDQAQRTTDKAITSGGTKAFRAPEVMNGTCKNLAAADIYSAGIILFAFKAQCTPFAEVTFEEGGKTGAGLEYYAEFLKENKKYWEIQAAKKNNKSFFSKEFKELINGMLQLNVEKRFTLADIKKSKWYRGPVLDAKRLKSEMKTRMQAFSNN